MAARLFVYMRAALAVEVYPSDVCISLGVIESFGGGDGDLMRRHAEVFYNHQRTSIPGDSNMVDLCTHIECC